MTKDTYRGLLCNLVRIEAARAVLKDALATLDYVDSHVAESVERADDNLRLAWERAHTRLIVEPVEDMR